MKNKDTTESFIVKARKVHGDKYDYSKVVYTKSKEKVLIICPHHGEFRQIPANHLQGQDCYQCRNKKLGDALRGNTEEFVKRVKAVHGDTYDYSKVKYVRNSSKVIITCRLHGDFEQVPASHLVGCGCPHCRPAKLSEANTNTTEDFLVRAREVHGDRYDYSKVEYKNFFTKVEIVCREHGSFWQAAGFHTSCGSGCPSCAHGGDSPNKVGTLYVLTSDNLTKVGITNATGKSRASYINGRSNHNFVVIKEYEFQNGAVCDQVETQILALLRKTYDTPSEKFHGYTECFYDVDREELLNILDDYHLRLDKMLES